MAKKPKAVKKEETNDIVQYLFPLLRAVGIEDSQCKVDTTTENTGRQRGDVWVSREKQGVKFEANIVALIEAKHRRCDIGDIEWRNAMEQGRTKAEQQGLPFYGVTNCGESFRFYNRFTDDELTVDGKFVTAAVPLRVLEKMLAQVNKDNSYVIDKAQADHPPVSESKFQRSLENKLKDVYRSCGLPDGDPRIDPTVAFVVLKYIGEQEAEQRTLHKVVRTWPDYGQDEKGNYMADFEQSRKDIFNPDYGNTYRDFAKLVSFPPQLKNEHYKQIYQELDQYHLHGCNFDVFGAVYEAFASQQKKKEFGEFYTRRHITGVIARLLFRGEKVPRELRVCDPACGTGGFLTEAYKSLRSNYQAAKRWDKAARERMEQETIWGFDNTEASVARAKLNMFMVGDGHTHIEELDTLVRWRPSDGWAEERFDFIITNPPMGSYEGAATGFTFTNERRYEMLFAERVVLATKRGGDIAIVVPDGMLEAPSREGFRKKLLSHCDIHAIVSLTKFAFAPYTKEKTYVVFARRKLQDDVGRVQTTPIWHFIVDYDGFANSDKRYRTKWHDDLPALEQHFDAAVELGQKYATDPDEFSARRGQFEAAVSRRELGEGLTGKKYGYAEMKDIGDHNFHNLLSEYHLRPHIPPVIPEDDFHAQAKDIATRMTAILKSLEK